MMVERVSRSGLKQLSSPVQDRVVFIAFNILDVFSWHPKYFPCTINRLKVHHLTRWHDTDNDFMTVVIYAYDIIFKSVLFPFTVAGVSTFLLSLVQLQDLSQYNITITLWHSNYKQVLIKLLSNIEEITSHILVYVTFAWTCICSVHKNQNTCWI